MKDFHLIMAGATAIILFIFGLDNFSKEVERISGERFRKFLGKATRMPILGVTMGAMITAFIQSSSATSVITIGLVNAGVLSFKNSVAIIFGANIGTTVTAQLVAFKLTSFAPYFIILGFVLSLLRSKFSIFGKAIFYFGFVFFSLNLISQSLSPLQTDERVISLLTQPQNIFMTIVIGAVFTAIFQSSSVTTGLAVIFIQQGILSLENGVPLIMGANIGTTSTALLAIFNMDIAAKKTALSQFLFNVGGVLLFTPIVYYFGDYVKFLSDRPSLALANFHFLFNVSTTIIFIIFLKPFTKMIDKILGEGKMDFERIQLPPLSKETNFSEINSQLKLVFRDLVIFLQKNYSLVTLSVETNYKNIYENAEKRVQYLEYFRKDSVTFLSNATSQINHEDESKHLFYIMNKFEYLFQIHDSIKDILSIRNSIEEEHIEVQSDLLLPFRELSSKTLSLFEELLKGMEDDTKLTSLKKEAHSLQSFIDEMNKDILSLLTKPERKDAGTFIHILTFSQRLKDKIVNFAKL